jgi:hypothetical protein
MPKMGGMEPRKEQNAEAVRVIQALGGTCAVAKLCRVNPASVSGWKINGIPDAREQYLRLLKPAAFKKRDN